MVSKLFTAMEKAGCLTIQDFFAYIGKDSISDDIRQEMEQLEEIAMGRVVVFRSDLGHVVIRRLCDDLAPSVLFADTSCGLCACLDHPPLVNWIKCDMEHYSVYNALVAYDDVLAIWPETSEYWNVPDEEYKSSMQQTWDIEFDEAAKKHDSQLEGEALSKAAKEAAAKVEELAAMGADPEDLGKPYYITEIFELMYRNNLKTTGDMSKIPEQKKMPGPQRELKLLDDFVKGRTTVSEDDTGNITIRFKKKGKEYTLLVDAAGTSFRECVGTKWSPDTYKCVIEPYFNYKALVFNNSAIIIWNDGCRDLQKTEENCNRSYRSYLLRYLSEKNIASVEEIKEDVKTLTYGVSDEIKLLEYGMAHNMKVLMHEDGGYVLDIVADDCYTKINISGQSNEYVRKCNDTEMHGTYRIETYGSYSIAILDGRVSFIWRRADVEYKRVKEV